MSFDLRPLAADDGLIVGAAADHRDSLRSELARRGLHVTDEEVADAKARIAEALAPVATLLLLDVELGAPAAIARGAIANGPPLVLPLENQGYGDVASVDETTLMEDFSPARAVDMGAAGCKLLLPFRVDRADQAARQERVAARCAEACRAAGIPLVLEPIVYRQTGEDLAPERYAELVVAGAARLAALDPGILKLQYPGSPEGCRALHEASAGSCWVLLGGGADEATLVGQVREACAAGAQGFVVGRTLWVDALVADADERRRRIAETVRPRLERLAAAVRAVRDDPAA
jgi:sulfofructosephosphate aldolase